MLVGGFHFLAVIPGRAQREPGIQRRLPNSRLDPGSALRAVRDDVPARPCWPSGMTLQGAKACHILFAVIPAKAGIQRCLRGACLNPDSALRAVRDDVNKESAVGDDVNKDRYAVGGDVNKEKAHRPG